MLIGCGDVFKIYGGILVGYRQGYRQGSLGRRSTHLRLDLTIGGYFFLDSSSDPKLSPAMKARGAALCSIFKKNHGISYILHRPNRVIFARRMHADTTGEETMDRTG